ncbi:MAG TPA: tetratricopeptide repeat protein [Sphingomicrobium sp.]|jgi:tetratricopeptide (TPR) repeat protein|nr:tetratricopeptide repeat protein [Sphingomicrobium sp.]
MKLMITTAALVLVAVSTPAAAQMSGQYGSQAPTPEGPTPPQAKGQQQAPNGQKPIKISGKASKAIGDLQTTVNKADYANLAAKVAAAQAVASTPDDKYAIGELQLKAAIAQKDNAGMASAVDSIASSGYVDSATSSKLYASLGTTFYNNKQFDQAAAAFQKAATSDPRNAEVYSLLGEAKFALGQKAEAAGDFQRAVQMEAAGGQKPDEALLKRAVSVAYDARSPLAVDLSRDLASSYPTPESWRNSIAIYRNYNHPDVEGTLDLLRLMQATGAMTSPGDYAIFAEAAADQSNYNEAQAVIDAGIAAHVVDPANPQFRDIVNGLKGKPKATAADLAAAAKMSPSAENLLHIGDRFYGMGDYSKAADVYRDVLAKPGADKDVANLHLGMALAKGGDKAGATAALNAVGGSRSDIAKYWMVYVHQHA